MASWLDTAVKRLNMDRPGGAPYHLKASFAITTADGTKSTGTLDVLHVSNGELSMTITFPDASFAIYNHNGNLTHSGSPNDPVHGKLVGLLQFALFSDRDVDSRGNQLIYQRVVTGGVALDCIDIHRSTIGKTLTPTRLCLDPKTRDLSLEQLPDGLLRTFEHPQAFGNLSIPSSVTTVVPNQFQISFHVDSLEPTTEKTISVP